ncbi:MAG: hypothetical protein ABEJ58_07260 [Halodesulfurarchaeum sp.]
MGLRCSLFGHDLGDPVTERNREDRGAEVVLTVRELRSCRRCGAERVLSENTEVRHRESHDEGPDIDAEDATAETAGGQSNTGNGDVETASESTPTPPTQKSGQTEVSDEDRLNAEEATAETTTSSADSAPDDANGTPEDADSSTDVAEFVEAAESGSTFQTESSESTPEEFDRAEVESEQEPTTRGRSPDSDRNDDRGEGEDSQETESGDGVDDAIIMNEENEGPVDREGDLGRGEVVEAGNMFETTPPSDEDGNGQYVSEESNVDREPDPTSVDETDPGPHSTDSVPEGEMRGESDQTDPSHRPEDPDRSSFEFGAGTGSEEADEDSPPRGDPHSGITKAGPIDVLGSPSDNLDAIFECPECGYTAPVAGSSQRAGDICPECHDGYLAERE